MVRERHIGRRLWRRRKRRSDPSSPSEPPRLLPPGPNHHDTDHDDGDDSDGVIVAPYPALTSAPPRAVGTVVTPPKQGFFARLFGKKPPPAPPPYLVVDPVADILKLPRGAARLDAFEQRVMSLTPGTDEHRVVALAFHAELVALATEAGVDLSLFETRVTACAAALIAAGEDEKAGGLFVRLGRRHQAAELFVKAGALDALEEAHAELAFTENAQRFDAKRAFERFEALFMVGRRDEALQSLELAVKLWDNPVYGDVLAGFRARLPLAGGVVLTAGDDVVRVVSRFPLVLGRGEESAVRIDSPLVSRAHVDIQRRAGELVLNDLVSSGGTRLDDVVISGPTALGVAGVIDLAGVQVDYDVSEQRLSLRPKLRARQLTLVVRGQRLDDVTVGFALTVDDGRVRLVADGRARMNSEAQRLDQLVLIGDRIAAAGRTWIVSG